MKAILINREGFTRELNVQRDNVRQVIAIAKYPHIGIYEEDSFDVAKPADDKILFYYERQYFDEHDNIVLIYKEK